MDVGSGADQRVSKSASDPLTSTDNQGNFSVKKHLRVFHGKKILYLYISLKIFYKRLFNLTTRLTGNIRNGLL